MMKSSNGMAVSPSRGTLRSSVSGPGVLRRRRLYQLSLGITQELAQRIPPRMDPDINEEKDFQKSPPI